MNDTTPSSPPTTAAHATMACTLKTLLHVPMFLFLCFRGEVKCALIENGKLCPLKQYQQKNY